MKKLTTFLLVLVLASLVFAGGSGDKNTLVVWDKSEYVQAYNKLSEARFKDFAESNGIELEYVVVPPNDLKPKLLAAIEAKNPPDIVVTDDFLAKQFAGMGQLADLSEIMDTVNFTQSGRNIAFTDSGEFLAPVSILAPGMYLRKDKWDAIGADYPETWEDLYQAAKKINNPSDNFYALGYPMGASGGGDAEGMCRSVILAYGGVPVDSTGKVTVNSPETLEALKFIAKLYEEGLTPPSAITWDDMGNNTAYIAGSVGVIQNSPSVFAQMQTDGNTDLLENTVILPFPGGPEGSYIPTGGNVFIVFNNGNQTDLAKKYISEFYEMDFYKNLVVSMGGMWQPIIEGAENDPFWQKPENIGWLKASQSGVPNTYPAPSNDLTNRAFAEQLCVKAVQKIVLNDVDPQEALDELELEFKRIME